MTVNDTFVVRGRRSTARVELGSGYDPTPGYLHVDLNPNAPDVDVVGPVWPLPWLEDGSVDEIRAVDVAEHVSYRDTSRMFAEWARVLRSGGTLFVQVPDADGIMRAYVRGDSRLARGIPPELPQTVLAGATWRLLGGHQDGQYARGGDDWKLNAHNALFSVAHLEALLREAGLRVVSTKVNAHPNIQTTAMKP